MNKVENKSIQKDILAKEKDSSAQEAFLDFEVEVGPGSGGVYPVAVVHSVAGEARGTTQLPFDDLVLENQLLTLQNALLRSGSKSRHVQLPQEEQSVQNFGRALFTALFPGEIGNLYAVSQREGALQGKGVRLKLRILAPEMATLPWEFLYDPSHAEYICLSRKTPVVRYLELPQPPQPFPATLPLQILGMVASPSNLPPLDVQREKLRMEQALAPLQQRGLVQLTWLSGQTWREVQQAMRHGPWHIFHFIGHGSFDPLTNEGLIAFVDENGQADMFRATQLGRLLADHSPLRLVVLNACEGAKGGQHDIFSSTAAILVRYGIPAVLAMQYAITDAAAIVFSRAFYEAISDGMPIDAAVSEARKAVSFAVENTLEWGVPVLFMRSPDGVLFNIDQGGAPAPSRPSPQQIQIPEPSPPPSPQQIQVPEPSPPPSLPTPPTQGPSLRPQPAHWKVSPGRLILLIALACIVIIGSVGAFFWFTQGAPKLQPDSSWITRISHTRENLIDIVWSGSQYVAVGNRGTILTSPDGVTWTPRTSGTQSNLVGVTWSGPHSQFVAVGAGGTILTSPDGITWTPQTSGTQSELRGIIWSVPRSQYVAVGAGGTILTSPDGITWTPRASGTPNILADIAWCGSQYVAVGGRVVEGVDSEGTVLTSPDGINWTSQTSGTQQYLRRIAWSGSRYVAVGNGGTILTSLNGIKWMPQTFRTEVNLGDVVWSGLQFVAVGDLGTVLTSPDGITWTSSLTPTASNYLRGISWSRSQFVVVGHSGTIITAS